MEGTDAWLVTDEGKRYRLPNAPEALADGERIEVCADEWPAGGEAVNWWGISSPPASERQPVHVASSSAIAVQETVAATSADQFPVETGPQVVDEAARLPGTLRGAFIVDRVELAYYYEPQPSQVVYSREGVPLDVQQPTTTVMQPVWVFHGHSLDGTIRFTAYVQAVTE